MKILSAAPAPGVRAQTMIAISSTEMQIALHSLETKFFPNYYFAFSLPRPFVSSAHFVSFTRIDPNASIGHYDSFQITYGIPYAGTTAEHFHFSLFHDPRRSSATQCNENSIPVITSAFCLPLAPGRSIAAGIFSRHIEKSFCRCLRGNRKFWRASIHAGETSEREKIHAVVFRLSADGSTLFPSSST